MPPVIEDAVIDFVDLDIDVVVWPDMKYDVLDRDDFKRNSEKYGYPDDVFGSVEAAVSELVGMIEGGEFPFDAENQKQI